MPAFGLLHVIAWSVVAVVAAGCAIGSLAYPFWYRVSFSSKTAYFGFDVDKIELRSDNGAFDTTTIACTALLVTPGNAASAAVFSTPPAWLKTDCDALKKASSTALSTGVVGLLTLAACTALVLAKWCVPRLKGQLWRRIMFGLSLTACLLGAAAILCYTLIAPDFAKHLNDNGAASKATRSFYWSFGAAIGASALALLDGGLLLYFTKDEVEYVLEAAPAKAPTVRASEIDLPATQRTLVPGAAATVVPDDGRSEAAKQLYTGEPGTGGTDANAQTVTLMAVNGVPTAAGKEAQASAAASEAKAPDGSIVITIDKASVSGPPGATRSDSGGKSLTAADAAAASFMLEATAARTSAAPSLAPVPPPDAGPAAAQPGAVRSSSARNTVVGDIRTVTDPKTGQLIEVMTMSFDAQNRPTFVAIDPVTRKPTATQVHVPHTDDAPVNTTALANGATSGSISVPATAKSSVVSDAPLPYAASSPSISDVLSSPKRGASSAPAGDVPPLLEREGSSTDSPSKPRAAGKGARKQREKTENGVLRGVTASGFATPSRQSTRVGDGSAAPTDDTSGAPATTAAPGAGAGAGSSGTGGDTSVEGVERGDNKSCRACETDSNCTIA